MIHNYDPAAGFEGFLIQKMDYYVSADSLRQKVCCELLQNCFVCWLLSSIM